MARVATPVGLGRWACLATAFSAILFAWPSVAQGADWYVATAAHGGNNGNACSAPGAPCLTINGALAKVGVADGDTMHIGPGTFAEGVTTSKELHFVGAGPGTLGGFNPATDTVIDAAGGNANAIKVMNAGGSVSDVRLLGQNTSDAGIGPGEALYIYGFGGVSALDYTVTNVVAIGGEVSGNPADKAGLLVDDAGSGRSLSVSASGSYFSSVSNAQPVVDISGENVSATLSSDTVAPQAAASALTARDGADVTLDRSQVVESAASLQGVLAVGDDGRHSHLLASRSAIFASYSHALLADNNASVDVLNSLVVLSSTGSNPNSFDSAAAATSVHSDTTAFLHARGSTFVASAPGIEAAVIAASCFPCNGSASVDLVNSIAKATDTDGAPSDVDLLADTNGGAGSAALAASNSNFNDTGAVDGGSVSAAGSASNVTGNPLFTDETNNDFTLQTGSPLIDRGDPSVVVPGELDLAGNARAQAFLLDCVAAPDLGAYELSGTPAACPAGAQPPPTPTESEPTLVISSRKLRVSKKRIARIGLRCEGSGVGRCDGELTLTTKKRFAIESRSKRRAKRVRLGGANVSLAAGQSTSARIKVTRRALTLLRRQRSLRATASAVTHGASGGDRTARALLKVLAPKHRRAS